MIPEPYQGPQMKMRYLTARSGGLRGLERVVAVYRLPLVRTSLLPSVELSVVCTGWYLSIYT